MIILVIQNFCLKSFKHFIFAKLIYKVINVNRWLILISFVLLVSLQNLSILSAKQFENNFIIAKYRAILNQNFQVVSYLKGFPYLLFSQQKGIHFNIKSIYSFQPSVCYLIYMYISYNMMKSIRRSFQISMRKINNSYIK